MLTKPSPTNSLAFAKQIIPLCFKEFAVAAPIADILALILLIS